MNATAADIAAVAAIPPADIPSASYLLERLVKHIFVDYRVHYHVTLHPKVVAYPSRFSPVSLGGDYCCTIEELWRALPLDETNYLALLVKPEAAAINDNAERLRFNAIAFIRARRLQGWHVLMFDEHTRSRRDVIVTDLSDFTDWPLNHYMTGHFAAIAQMLRSPAKELTHPIVSIRYGDGGLRPREGQQQQGGTFGRTGLSKALLWLEQCNEEGAVQLQPIDGRTRGMQIISEDTVFAEPRFWHDDSPDEQNPLNPEREETPDPSDSEQSPSPPQSQTPPPPYPGREPRVLLIEDETL